MKKLAIAFLYALTLSAVASAEAETITQSPMPPLIVTQTSGLPICNTATQGLIFVVTDALLPVVGSLLGGGGLITVAVRCNGTNYLVI